jgi:uncharacterized protein (TIGR01244 family)
MGDFKRVTEDFFVSPQITVDDVRRAAAAGFRTVVNNRPDGEDPFQTPGAEIEAVARELGLQYEQIHVSGAPQQGAIDALRSVIEGAGKPILAYCRSGTRSITLWALAAASSRDAEEIVAAGRAAGYDLHGLSPRLLGMRGS